MRQDGCKDCPSKFEIRHGYLGFLQVAKVLTSLASSKRDPHHLRTESRGKCSFDSLGSPYEV